MIGLTHLIIIVAVPVIAIVALILALSNLGPRVTRIDRTIERDKDGDNA